MGSTVLGDILLWTLTPKRCFLFAFVFTCLFQNNSGFTRRCKGSPGRSFQVVSANSYNLYRYNIKTIKSTLVKFVRTAL